MKAQRCTVTGRVQRVGFRWWAKKVADELGITGWVRNGPDGEVEVMLQGGDDVVEDFLAKLAQGPPMAEVANVQAVEAEVEAELGGFEIWS